LEKKADKFVLADEYLRDVAVDGKNGIWLRWDFFILDMGIRSH
jgi:hypothetical protein